MKKSILYLDQNFVSNLAKAENVPSWKDQLRDYYQGLLQLLRTKVSQNHLACPTSYFHRQESEQNDRVKGHTWPLVECLSHGLSFNSLPKIHLSQIASAAYAYAGKPACVSPDWAIAFNQDPQLPVVSNPAGDQIMVHLESGQEVMDYYRDTTNLAADLYGDLKRERKGQSRIFQDEVLYLKQLLLFETFMPPGKLIQDNPGLEGDLSNLGAISVMHNQTALLAVFRDCDLSEKFFTSQELLECPFLHIRSSLMAADILNYPDMAPSPSLGTDFNIVASIMPYVDLLATDNHMAELIRQARLSSMFPAQVFSMNRRNELLKAIEML